MHKKECEYIVNNAEAVEAAIILNNSGLPIAWYCKNNQIIDEVASISGGLLAIARELYLFDTTSVASMVFQTSFGVLHIRTIDTNSLLVLCLTNGYSFLMINRILQKLITNST
jgi:predicted regulator of Ras-like GTPase activity (Roadblock/LC7/MglB family)